MTTGIFDPEMDRDTFTHLEIEAALCVWEWLYDVTCVNDEKHAGWLEIKEQHGMAEMRYNARYYGRWALAVYEICTKNDNDFFGGYAYDWEVIPAIMQELVLHGPLREVANDIEQMPCAGIAAIVIRAKFEKDVKARRQREWLASVKHLAKQRYNWGDVDEAQALKCYADKMTAEQFLEWVTEKYGIERTDGPWGLI